MTFLLFFTLIATSKVDKVRSIEIRNDEATVTFWGMSQVFRMPADAKVLPCLDNSMKAEKEVLLKMTNPKSITKCRIYGGGALTI